LGVARPENKDGDFGGPVGLGTTVNLPLTCSVTIFIALLPTLLPRHTGIEWDDDWEVLHEN
jgi:hypothetical protein